MKGAVIELRQQASYPGAPDALVATSTTDARGGWKFRVPRGPSRVLTVGYRSRSKDPSFSAQLQYHETVKAGVRLTAPRHAQPGRSFDFHGRLAGGYVSAGGVLVNLELFYGGQWREIALLYTDSRGRFTYRYSFAAIGPTVFRFRASLPPAAFYPFAPAASPSTRIHLVRG
jgi:hypothetical protein